MARPAQKKETVWRESTFPKIVAVIPARYGASRLSGKPLVKINGKPLVQHSYEQAKAFRLFADVIVATDDRRVAAAVRKFGGKVQMTDPDHPSGTERVAEVARKTACDIVVNLQGDELGLAPAYLERLIRPFIDRPVVQMTTLARPISSAREVRNPHQVKVVTDRHGDALYFSRSPLPFPTKGASDHIAPLGHIGVYAYRRDFLLHLCTLPPTPLEKTERLEQLRVLEHGEKIHVAVVDTDTIRIDTPADLKRARQILERQGKKRNG